MARFQPNATSTPKRRGNKKRGYGMRFDNDADVSEITVDHSRHYYDEEVFENYVHPTGEELNRVIEDIWKDWVPPHGGRTEIHGRSAAQPPATQFGQKPNEDDMELVDCPGPQHVFVPKWIYFARDQQREVFVMALKHYFKCYRWPKLTELPPWFMQVCLFNGIPLTDFERTSGFAPVWMFFLRELIQKKKLDPRWFDRCITAFFDTGSFPELNTMPAKLIEMCNRAGINEDTFFQVAGE